MSRPPHAAKVDDALASQPGRRGVPAVRHLFVKLTVAGDRAPRSGASVHGTT